MIYKSPIIAKTVTTYIKFEIFDGRLIASRLEARFKTSSLPVSGKSKGGMENGRSMYMYLLSLVEHSTARNKTMNIARILGRVKDVSERPL
jgi:hypothetical protein